MNNLPDISKHVNTSPNLVVLGPCSELCIHSNVYLLSFCRGYTKGRVIHVLFVLRQLPFCHTTKCNIRKKKKKFVIEKFCYNMRIVYCYYYNSKV